MSNNAVNQTGGVVDGVDDMLQEFLRTIHQHRTEHQRGTLSEELEKFYLTIGKGNPLDVMIHLKKAYDYYLILDLFGKFIKELEATQFHPVRLAFDFNNSTVLVWAVVENEEEEEKLYLSEMKVNSEFYAKGYKVDTIVVESENSLNITIPSHFKDFTAAFN